MGILLTFMFVWNMIGALVLIPALSHFLLPTESSRPAGAACTGRSPRPADARARIPRSTEHVHA